MSSFRPLVVATLLLWQVPRGGRAEEGQPDASGPTDASWVGHVRGEGQFFGLVAIPFEGDPSLGFGLGVAAGWGPIPVTFGIDLLAAFGAVERTRIAVDVQGERLLLDRSKQDRLLFFDVWLRVQPAYWRIRPYVEGFVGTKLLRTEYTLGFVTGEGVSELADARDWTRSIGFGAGFDVSLPNTGDGLSFSLGFRRLYSDDAAFVRTIRTEQGDLPLRQRVPLGANLITLGLTGHFDFWGARARAK